MSSNEKDTTRIDEEIKQLPSLPAIDVDKKLYESISKDDEKGSSTKEEVREEISTENTSEHIIRTGYDVSEYLLSTRDDGDPSLTFRSIVLGIIVSAFQATMTQIYFFKPTNAVLGGSFMVLIIYFIGVAWSKVLPSGPKLKAKWGERPSTKFKRTTYKIVNFINPGPFGLKEHACAAITASSASNGIEALIPFTCQLLFYDVPLIPTNVVLCLLSSGLFGYGLTGLLRPIIIAPSAMVYWSNIPLIQQFQRLHWDTLDSKPLRWFWYSFAFMTIYEIVPAYMFPLLVAFSIPCLASQNAPASKRKLLTNLFGGSVSNEGLGLFSLNFDWQYIGSNVVSYPLIWQANTWIGLVFCYIIFLAVYYGNAFGARDLPFMSTRLYQQDNTKYPTMQLFSHGTLNETVLAEYGTPRLTATFAWGMFTGLAAIGAMIMHTFLFYGPKLKEAIKEALNNKFTDRHHRAVLERYRDVHWLWYASLMVIASLFGLIANLSGKTTLPVKSYLLSLFVGSLMAPFSSILYAQFGSGVTTYPIMKMIAGLTMPNKPLGILYFQCWSHSCVAQTINLAADLKMGTTFLKIPPYIMFFTQVLGTILGAFINYAVMTTIVKNQKDTLLLVNGSQAWSGQFFQGANLQATVWALSKEMYGIGKPYMIIPFGVPIGMLAVVVQRGISHFFQKIGFFEIKDMNLAMVFMYLGWFALQTQTCVILSIVLVGIFVQFYLRNYKPKFFKNYVYLIAAGLDGGSLLTIFVLSFAVFGASGPQRLFPNWWGNPEGFPDRCPNPE